MPAVISFDFDPSASILGLSVRLETLAIAGAVFVVLVLAALSSGRSGGSETDEGSAEADAPVLPKLRRDDLILIAFGAVPGAVIGGRIGYVLLHLDYYVSSPWTIVDPAQGGFGLTMAVVLGTLTAIAVARLLAAPVGRWLGVAALPVVLGLGLGKLATALGGVGQGAYSNASWTTSYLGNGPWGSTNPDFAAIPSQLIEGAGVIAAAVLLFILPSLLRLRLVNWHRLVRPGLAPRRDWVALTGRNRYLTALSLWAAVRLIVASTWRDARVLGPFVAEQVILVAVAVGVLFGPSAVGTLRGLLKAVAARRAARRLARAEKATRRAEVQVAARDADSAAEPAPPAAEAPDAPPLEG